MNTLSVRPYFLLALIFGALLLAFYIFLPFLIPLALAVIFAVILQPLYQRILKQVPHVPGIAAVLTILITVICIVLPISLLAIAIFGELQQLYTSLSTGGGQTQVFGVAQSLQDWLHMHFPATQSYTANFSTSLDTYVRGGIAWAAVHAGAVFSSITAIFFSLFVFLISLYYFLRDGHTFKEAMVKMSPLDDADDRAVFMRLEMAINSVIRGSLTVAFLQAILTGIGFTIFGVPNSLLWGMVAFFTALIPGIGTSLVLVPGILYLFISGATLQGIGMLCWGMLGVGLVDNLLGPRLVSKGVRMHPLLILLSVFGGLAVFGPTGIFLGPLCASLLFALLEIYSNSTTVKE